MKVFLYMRVSSEEQARHGYSLDAQQEALRDFCEKHNHVILGEYLDGGVSGRKPYTKRPAMVQLLKDIEAVKPDMVLFTKLDRWFRNIKEYYKVQDILDKHKVDWKAINEEYDTSTASGRLYVNIKLSIAQDEADRTSERIKDTHAQRVAQGKVLGGKVPFGYKVDNCKLVFGDDIHIVKEAVDHYMLHHSAITTIRYINEKYDLHWTYDHLNRLIHNPILKGQYRDNPNFCEALITPAEWDRLQMTSKKNVKHASYRVYFFSGLIKCPCCGKTMGGSNMGGAKYYRCNNHLYGACEMNRYVSERKLEKWLLENIEDDYKVKVTVKPKAKKDNPQKYRDRLKRLNDMYLFGNISEAEYKAKSAEIQQKIAELSKNPPLKTQIFASNWKDLYHELDDEHKRSFWQNLVREISVTVEAQGFAVLY